MIQPERSTHGKGDDTLYELGLCAAIWPSLRDCFDIEFNDDCLNSHLYISITPNSINTFLRIQLSGTGFIRSYVVTLTSGFSFVVTAGVFPSGCV
ncbi:hypothetical protein BLNAU_23609 [Blattamonas nauphoetae]|uniref:Uncharacterized protein n=1 Tax=Blattamonas nauphoetae TaxID=2049346 RepID=A0ABQ9WPQ1_9EUKA|nr:hypothetical protein BLNAU_23609 [Blattamonas nauphoetae]